MKVQTYLVQIGNIIILFIVMLGLVGEVAYCESIYGPVIKDTKVALETADVTAVLKWVKKEHEAEVIAAFDKALIESTKGQDAKEEAEKDFYETLIRIHREDDRGRPYVGLKHVNEESELVVVEADRALDIGSVDGLVQFVTEDITKEIRNRFANVIEKKKYRDESVEAGREFAKRYIEFINYMTLLYFYIYDRSMYHTPEVKAMGNQE